jgi:hypothetical protein
VSAYWHRRNHRVSSLKYQAVVRLEHLSTTSGFDRAETVEGKPWCTDLIKEEGKTTDGVEHQAGVTGDYLRSRTIAIGSNAGDGSQTLMQGATAVGYISYTAS